MEAVGPPADDYESAVRALGPVDLLCSHVPPRIPVLRYDVIPARMEMYGPGLLESIDESGLGGPCSGTCTSRSACGRAAAARNA